MSNTLIVEGIGRSLVVKFNRPELRNPLSIDVLESLASIVENIDHDSLIFTGTDGVFASGADLREIAEVSGEEAARKFAMRGQNLMDRIAGLRCATTAAIDGVCFGGALDLALSCDRRIASPYSIFSHPGANLGIMTGWGGTQRLTRLTGEAKALEMFFTAKRIGAEEALSTGLISSIADDPLEAALN